MTTIHYQADADSGLITRRRVAVMGFGSQGHAHALNLKDSGVDVIVGLRENSPRVRSAADAGLKVVDPGTAAEWADVIMLLVPDQVQKGFYSEIIRPRLSEGDALFVAHGFSIHFGFVTPPGHVDVAMVAPKGPGHLVRRQYVEGSGVPALVAVHQDSTGDAFNLALSYADAIGSTRAGVIETTFKDETETDLFGEQVILCGGIDSLIQAAFEVLTDGGYEPEIAYFEVLHELKLIVDLLWEGGIEWMRHSISDTAEYGDITRGPRIVTADTKAEMARILSEIQSGEFAREWMAEYEAGSPRLTAARKTISEHPVEDTGRALREMMTFMVAKSPKDDV